MKTYKHFNKLGSTYQYKGFERTLGLKYLSEIETKFVKENIPSNKKILELGIGTGRNAELILEKGNILYGIDAAEKMLCHCKKRFKKEISENRLKLIHKNLKHRLPFRQNSLDQLICIRVIKYVDNWRELLRESYRVLKRDGVLVIEFPNKYSYEFIAMFVNRLLNFHYTTFSSNDFENTLVNQKFVRVKEFSGTKFPHFFYSTINNRRLLNVVIYLERLLTRLFGNFLSRNTIVVYIKK